MNALLAIPSPDLVVNLFASAAQALGLLAVVVGGVSMRRRSARRGRGGSPWPFRVCLGLFLACGASFLLYHLHVHDREQQRLRVNLVRSSTEGGVAVGDASLKTLGFSGQQQREDGLSTEDLAAALDAGEPMNLIDVREPEEAETGRIEGTRAFRYPDLRRDASPLRAPGRTVLMCYSGNRSSELSEEFRAAGLATEFLVGGYEKWMAERRPLVGAPEDRTTLRGLPSFPHDDTLLDTDAARRLVEEEGALFVDVRYPKDFELRHLPGAVCIPLRKLETDDMWARLRALPRRPIVVPCYDKRSSFYGLILGLRLTRLGYDFRGRYTVPDEYYVPAASKTYVAEWRKDLEGTTLAGMVSSTLDSVLVWLRDRLGSLSLAILALVLLLRVAVLPLSLKSDRDRVVQRALAPAVGAIKSKHADDKSASARAIMALYKKHDLAPVKTMIGTILQVLLFIVLFTVVGDVARGTGEGLLWLPTLGEPDPWFVLPALIGVFIFLHMHLDAARRNFRAVALRVAAGGLLFALTFQLSAAINVYLAFNVFLLILQGWWVRKRTRTVVDGDAAPLPRKFRGARIVPLALAHRVPGTGNKAIRLGRMAAAGLPVPDGFVVTAEALAGDAPITTRVSWRAVRREWKRIGAKVVAVRSSGLNEDGADQSYAGVFESLLDVPYANLEAALEEVRSSLCSARAQAYGGASREEGGIVVQKMVPAQYAGVLFTEHPESPAHGLVELVEGLGEDLVSGRVTPKSYRFSRATDELDTPAPVDLAPLFELARKAEQLFGGPQDIEWAYADGAFRLLQARDITVLRRHGDDRDAALQRVQHAALEAVGRGPADEVVLAQTELTELLPNPSPFSLAFMRRLWGPGGSVDLAAQDLGVPYDVDAESAPYVLDLFGSLYVNRAEERRRFARGLGAVASFRLTRLAPALEQEFAEDFRPAHEKKMREREAVRLDGFAVPELLELLADWQDEFLRESYVVAHRINLAAEFTFKSAAKKLADAGLDGARFLEAGEDTVVHEAMSLLPRIRAGEVPVEEFLRRFGHRAPQDFEFAQPRYREDPARLERMIARATTPVRRHAPADLDGLKPLVRVLVERARRFQVLKEEAKHATLREVACLRAVVLELGLRLGIGDEVFRLTAEELAALADPAQATALEATLAQRVREAGYMTDMAPPTELTRLALEGVLGDGEAVEAPEGAALAGTRVSGKKEVVGYARVVREDAELDGFRPGEVLVARFTDPTWTPVFPAAAGIVTEVGGWLSHAAIQAREYDIAGVVGVRGALRGIETGRLVRLRMDGGIEFVDDRRREPRVRVEMPASILAHGRQVSVPVVDVSRSGLRIGRCEADALAEGDDVTVRLGRNSEPVPAVAAKQLKDGGYVLTLIRPLDVEAMYATA